MGIAAMSANVRLSCCTFAVLTTPRLSGAASRLQPMTAKEYAMPLGSSVGEVESEQDANVAPAAIANAPAMSLRRER